MSEYRVEEHVGLEPPKWEIHSDDLTLAWCYTEADAERIARALRVLDAMEERDTQITEAMQDMAEDEPAVPQARGEG